MQYSKPQLDLENKRQYMQALVLAVYRITDKFPREEHLRLKMREEALNILSHMEHIYGGGDRERYNDFVNSIQTLVHYCEVAGQQGWMDKANFAVLKHELFKMRNTMEMPEQVEELPYPDIHEETESKKNHSDTSLNDEAPPHHLTAEQASADSPDFEVQTTRANYNGQTSAALYADLNNFNFYTTEDEMNRAQKPKEETRARKDGGNSSAPKPNKPRLASKESKPQNQELSERQKKILRHLSENGKVQASDLSQVLESVSTRTIRRDLDKLIQLAKVKKLGKTNGAQYKLA